MEVPDFVVVLTVALRYKVDMKFLVREPLVVVVSFGCHRRCSIHKNVSDTSICQGALSQLASGW
jgi:hypothetical protein